jgi:preprotein translocase subunit SecA
MMLGAIDRQWVDYLTAMDDLRQSINLQAFAQRDPLVEFKRKSFEMFDELKANITRDIVYQILPASFQYENYLRQIEAEQQQRLAAAQRAGGSSEEQSRSRTVRKTVPMPGRNDPCPCGSGRKFKQCHLGREDEIMHLIQGGAQADPAVQLATGQNGGKQDAVAAEAAAIREAGKNSQQQPQGKNSTARGRAAPSGGKTSRGKPQGARRK